MIISILAGVVVLLALAAYDLRQRRTGGRPLIGFFFGRMEDHGLSIPVMFLRVGSIVVSAVWVPYRLAVHVSTESIETWRAEQA